MNYESISLKDLTPDPSNVRKHDSKNLDTIKASLLKFGQVKPIVIDAKGLVIAGNGTLQAARDLGWDTLACVRSELSGVEATAYAIADNRTSELAEWDDQGLAEVLAALQNDEDFDHLAAGFTDDEIAELISDVAGDIEVVEDEIPEPPENPITKPGDLWLLGEHRLLCGDSTKAEDVARVMGGEKADLLLTDPPYGIDKAEWDSEFPAKQIANLCRESKAFGIMPGLWALPKCISAVSSSYKWLLCGHLVNGMTHGAVGYSNWIPCIVGGAIKHGGQDAHDFTVGTEAKPDHPSPKPLAFIAWLIERITDGQIIFDPFLGSGTTLIAAEQLNRKCYGIEISPAYCDVIVHRWEALTGQKATLEQEVAV